MAIPNDLIRIRKLGNQFSELFDELHLDLLADVVNILVRDGSLLPVWGHVVSVWKFGVGHLTAEQQSQLPTSYYSLIGYWLWMEQENIDYTEVVRWLEFATAGSLYTKAELLEQINGTL